MGLETFRLGAVVLLCVLAASRLSQCSPCDAYKQNNASMITRCNSLIKSFEVALLTDNNLYILSDIFLSTMHRPPSVLIVEYNLTYSNGTNLKLDVEHLPELTYGWTSSSTYAIVDPLTVFTLEMGTLGFVYYLVQHDHDSLIPDVKLYLDISNTSIEATVYSKDELSFALKTITTELEYYAQRQDKMKYWDGKEYVWKFEPHPLIVFAEISLFLLVFVASLKFGVQLFNRVHNQEPLPKIPALIRSLAIVTFSWNVLDFAYNIGAIFLFADLNRKATENVYFAVSKLGVYISALIFALVWMTLGYKASRGLFPLEQGYAIKPWKNKFFACFYFFNISFFIFLITATIIPVIILSFVNPVIALSVVALHTTIFFSQVILLISVPITELHVRHSEFHKNCFSLYMKFFLFIFFSMIMYFLVYLYLEIVTKGADPSDYFKILLSLVLSSAIAGAIYVVKKKFLTEKKDGENGAPSANSNTSQSESQLAELEEGRGATRANGTSEDQNGGTRGSLEDESRTSTDSDSHGPNSED